MDQAQDKTKLFIGNLAYSVTNDMLNELFAQFGTVVEATVVMDKFSGRSRGFGFVKMSTEEEAQKAIEALNEQEYEGRPLMVNVARPPKPRAPRAY